jgi:hypothetical protein
MLLDRWNPVFSPDVDAGTPEPAEPAPPPMNERPVDGPGSGRSALRKELEKNVESTRKAQEPEPQPAKGKGKYVSTARKEGVAETPEAPVEEAETQEPVAEPDVEAASQYKVPEGWAKEAKAEWSNLPPQVQAAVAKRETDMAKGVEDLKGKYADIDRALQPRMELLRRHGKAPAEAIHNLFSWFEALSVNPAGTFPALANSFKFDLRTIPGLIPQPASGPAPAPQAAPQATGQPAAEGQPAGEVSPAIQQYLDNMKQELAALKGDFTNQLGQLSNSFQQQSQAKTEEILASWSKDKPYFEDVRKMMAHLIASQAIPPLQNGAADLDKAYDMALWALPEIRQKVLAEQQKAAQDAAKAKRAAEQKAQQEQADKARKAQAGSITGSAPGAPGLPAKPKKGKTVAESIRDAMNELSE